MVPFAAETRTGEAARVAAMAEKRMLTGFLRIFR